MGKVGNEARQTPGQAESTRTINEPHLPEKGRRNCCAKLPTAQVNETDVSSDADHFTVCEVTHCTRMKHMLTDVSSGADHFTVCKYRDGKLCDAR